MVLVCVFVYGKHNHKKWLKCFIYIREHKNCHPFDRRVHRLRSWYKFSQMCPLIRLYMTIYHMFLKKCITNLVILFFKGNRPYIIHIWNERQLIIDLITAGIGGQRVNQRLNCSMPNVIRVFSRHGQIGPNQRLSRTAQTRKPTARYNRRLSRLVLWEGSSTLEQRLQSVNREELRSRIIACSPIKILIILLIKQNKEKLRN